MTGGPHHYLPFLVNRSPIDLRLIHGLSSVLFEFLIRLKQIGSPGLPLSTRPPTPKASTNRYGKIPPVAPHGIAFFGNALQLFLNPVGFTRTAAVRWNKQSPYMVKLPFTRLFFFHGAKNITAIFKEPAFMNAVFIHTTLLKQLFGMSSQSVQMYIADNSGPYAKAEANSNVKPQNRIEYLTHENLVKGLTGPGLDPAFDRFTKLFDKQLAHLSVTTEWLEYHDVFQFIQDTVGPALLESIFGPTLLSANPNMIRDLSDFDSSARTLTLLKGLPSIPIFSAYRARDKILENVKRWHRQARRMFSERCIDPDGNGDPYWGCEMIRERQKILLGVENLDHDSVASADLGLMFAAFTTMIPTATMSFIHTYSDPNLTSQLRQELEYRSNGTSFDIKNLEKSPRLRSLFSEVLRTYLATFITRCAPDRDLHVYEWILPKRSVMILNTYVSHHDSASSVWNTKGGQHPLDEFWAERFLVWPDDDATGPCKDQSTDFITSATKRAEPIYSINGLKGSFLPFGGGIRMCPGRHLAHRMNLWITATLLSRYEIEIVTPEKHIELDWSVYGLGILRPKNPTPFRIRRKT
ncbi:cytochrome P450 [Pseudovirgaria hyperparasitica]|uniref:Cytochrome P450 n=1 Tax=Pseudovirgaria hyperparasitica TaxID=470096 RepID=A0A6A6WC38_9PEZI|nr:cytochrome P450 [Pseudovirgaria hyperparasitica]KAF2759739.1 cytochrome P450 [Pseudovirgaria hyperparasitica]